MAHDDSGAAAAAAPVVPIPAQARISSIDVLRGCALLGILLMNITAFGLPGAAFSDPTIAGGATGANRVWWLIGQIVFEGKMRTIFSMLFGAGVVLLTSRAEQGGGAARIADIYYRRTIWLIVFGLVHAYFIWSGDILYGYGVAGLFLFPFRKRPAAFLIAAGLLVLAVGVPKSILEGRRLDGLRVTAHQAEEAASAGTPLTDEQKEAQGDWRELLEHMKPTPSQVQKEIDDHRAGYTTLFLRRMDEVSEGQSRGFYRFGFFDVAGMMLLGMGLLKLDVFSAARAYRVYGTLVVLGYAVGMPISGYIAERDAAHGFDPAQMYFGWSAYDLGRLSVALGHIGLVMIVCKAGLLRGLTSRLAAVGQMALSNYLLTSILCTAIFEGYGFGLFARLERAQLLYVVVPVWLFQLAASPIWLRHFRFGPMEWVWRSLTYWRLQPMRLAQRRPAAAEPAAAGSTRA